MGFFTAKSEKQVLEAKIRKETRRQKLQALNDEQRRREKNRVGKYGIKQNKKKGWW